MIDMPPSVHSCILSTMEFVLNKAERYNQAAILTFDQPLYWKWVEIAMHVKRLEKIVLILGQFHTRMSFIGSIDHLMTNSGLESVLKLVYADHAGKILFMFIFHYTFYYIYLG